MPQYSLVTRLFLHRHSSFSEALDIQWLSVQGLEHTGQAVDVYMCTGSRAQTELFVSSVCFTLIYQKTHKDSLLFVVIN